MDVIALVGPSGTGKSHRALQVAQEHHADAIIDDGILIKDGHIIAGESAKTEKSRIMAVRRAIFVLPGHAQNSDYRHFGKHGSQNRGDAQTSLDSADNPH